MNNSDTKTVLAGLKPFQRASVKHAFNRLYKSADSSKRFLVADEVGLGKTIVAKGVIAKVVERLKDKDRIDIIYICSNADIARQNISRLNVTSEKPFIKATRLSLLATVAKNLNENKLNFISFTPGTTFSKGYRFGSRRERRLLYKILTEHEHYQNNSAKRALARILQGNVNAKRWKRYIKDKLEYDATIAEAFIQKLEESLQGDQSLKSKLDNLIFKCNDQETTESKEQCLKMIGKLRGLLADCSLSALKPSLIIMDEFQRFSELLGNDETAETAKKLFAYKTGENDSEPRILLLSATPYKIYANRNEEVDNYQEFLKTLQFLANVKNDECKPISLIKQDFEQIKTLMQSCVSDNKAQLEDLGKIRNRLQKNLLKLMCRTERVNLTKDQNSMLEEELIIAELTKADLLQLSAMAEVLGYAPKQLVELWKSSPYIFNFMKKDSYQLKKEFDSKLSNKKMPKGAYLNIEGIQDFSSDVDAGNLKLRKLLSDHLNSGLWKLLWIPPSMPYWQLSGEYQGTEKNSITKELIFSSWDVVPDALTSMISYAVEQKMVTEKRKGNGRGLVYIGFAAKHTPKLNFDMVDAETKKPKSMAMFSALFPVPVLAKLLDPAIHRLNGNGIPTLEDLKRLVEQELDKLIKLGKPSQEDTKSSFHHYIAALAATSEQPCLQDVGTGKEIVGGYESHKEEFANQINQPSTNWQALEGKDKQDIINMVLGGPGVCALRALKRLDKSNEITWNKPELLNAAIQISEGIRTLFNRPEVTAMLTNTSNKTESYWERVLRYCVDGNLQAVLDEYVHMVSDSIGGANGIEKIEAVAKEVREALSLKTSRIGADTYGSDNVDGNNKLNIRTHYATRFADSSSDVNVEGGNRKQSVISAFNSPFRPFVLVSTSVGQEGLDFHHWCHSVLHWNLPSNPVDLEQREGRVHRWKNHAVRKNVALEKAKKLEVNDSFTDIWSKLFALASKEFSGKGELGLYPNWLYEPEGGVKIKRRIINPPLSGDIYKYRNLQSYLSLYRMAFGQPRQEDFIKYLEQKFGDEAKEFAKEWQIQLSPIKKLSS